MDADLDSSPFSLVPAPAVEPRKATVPIIQNSIRHHYFINFFI